MEHSSRYARHAWLFRGVTDANFKLIPKIGRPQARKKGKDRKRIPYEMQDERAVFAMFKQQARAYLSSAPKSDLEWLAIAQHFGLPTRLLDWTDSFLVAAWFAVESGGAGRIDSAIWVAKGLHSIDMDDQGEALNFAEPYCYRPPHMEPRITAQGSVFVICPHRLQNLFCLFAKR